MQIAVCLRLGRSRRDRLLLPHPRAARRAARGGALRDPRAAACRASPSCSRGTACAPRSSSSARDLDDDAEGRARWPRSRAPATSWRTTRTRTRTTSSACGAGAHRRRDRSRARRDRAPAPGTPPVGFRAPGYEISARGDRRCCARAATATTRRCSRRRRYYGAKAAVMGAMRVVGRHVGQRARQPARAAGAARAYRPAAGAPYRRGRRRHRRAADRGDARGAAARHRHQPDPRARLAARGAWSRRRCARRSSTWSCTASICATPAATAIPPR